MTDYNDREFHEIMKTLKILGLKLNQEMLDFGYQPPSEAIAGRLIFRFDPGPEKKQIENNEAEDFVGNIIRNLNMRKGR